MIQLRKLIQSVDNVNTANSLLNRLIKCFGEAKELQFMKPLPEDKMEKQPSKYFDQKAAVISSFFSWRKELVV